MSFYHHHHHHITFMELGHLLTRSDLTYPEVSSKVYHDSFCQLGSSILLPWVIYFEAFYLHVVSSFSCIPVICPKLVLLVTPLQFMHLFFNLSKCILWVSLTIYEGYYHLQSLSTCCSPTLTTSDTRNTMQDQPNGFHLLLSQAGNGPISKILQLTAT